VPGGGIAGRSVRLRSSALRTAAVPAALLSEMAGETPAIPDWSKRGAGIEPGVHDLRAGREPHAVMRGDVADGFVEPGDAMRHADQIRMQADRHDAAGLRALGVKGVELAV